MTLWGAFWIGVGCGVGGGLVLITLYGCLVMGKRHGPKEGEPFPDNQP